MDKESLEIRSRLLALEYLLTDLYVEVFGMRHADPAGAADQWKGIVKAQLAQATFPGMSPEQSDLRIGEMTEKVLDLAEIVVVKARLRY